MVSGSRGIGEIKTDIKKGLNTKHNNGYNILWVSALPKVRENKKGIASGI